MLEQPRVSCGVLARRGVLASAIMVIAALGLAVPVPANARHHWTVRAPRAAAHFAASLGGATDPAKDAAIVIDAESGQVLFSRNASVSRHPASLTKMMTLYLLFD